jgi:hypothetical protein
MFVLCLLHKDNNTEHKSQEEERKDSKVQNESKEQTGRDKISPRGKGCLSLVSVLCCPVAVSATSWSSFQSSPTGCVCVI